MKSFAEEFNNIKQFCQDSGFKERQREFRTILLEKQVIIYGAGVAGVSEAKRLIKREKGILCFCDKYKTGIEPETGLPIISPQTMAEKYFNDNKHPQINVIICSNLYYNEMKQDLNRLGIAPLETNTKTLDEIEPFFEELSHAFNLFIEDESKRIFVERIKCYLTSVGITRSREKQYFDSELISLSDDEVFVDGGMYTGDTEFFTCVNNKYKHYHGFEPDLENFNKADKFFKGKLNVSLNAKGLWSIEKRLNFNGNCDASSNITDDGNDIIDVTSLDTYFSDKDSPTFIKMDIEGAELEALKGSENIIRKYKPKLAICVYHKFEDLYTLPKLIKGYRDDYTLYLRHYSDVLSETVLYAI